MEYNLGKLHGKTTIYFSWGIENALYDAGKEVTSWIVKEDQAFFTRTGEVKTALDKDTYRNNLRWQKPKEMPKGGLADDEELKGGLADDEEQKGALADAAWEDQPGYVFRGALAEDK